MGFIPSPYFQTRRGYGVDLIVIHTTVGTYQGTITYFKNNDRQVSSHYVTSLKGEITQMVEESMASHHAGIVSGPRVPLVLTRSGISPNFYSIGIENADDGNPHSADRSLQYPPLILLVADLCRRYNVPADRDHIVGHKEIYNKKTCPGNLDVDYIVSEVKKRLGQSPPSNGETMSKITDFLGMNNEDEAIKRLTEHLGMQDGKCDWGNEEGDRGGYLGGARRKIKQLESQPNSSSTEIMNVPATILAANRTWDINGVQLDSHGVIIGNYKQR